MVESFFELTPEPILTAAEQIGVRSTGRSYALNSLENRVYEIELEDDRKVVAKFYRPGRWTRDAILEEHEFLADLAAQEVPVVEPLKLKDNSTLGTTDGGIFFTVFPKVRGRAPEELKPDQLTQLGRFVGRLHNVGATKTSKNRLLLDPKNYGRPALQFLSENNWLPMELATRYKTVAEEIINLITPWFENIKTHRIHGDCHLGNLLYDQQGNAFFLDFDDMVAGPAVQDFWLLVPGQDEKALQDREIFLKGYTEMRQFDRGTLRLIEPLRALRIIHYSAWIARRWKDPSFQRVFTEFNTHNYWENEIRDLKKQRDIIKAL
jgi:Ser/Thr protein kinase RdoA (MazF antagonist)